MPITGRISEYELLCSNEKHNSNMTLWAEESLPKSGFMSLTPATHVNMGGETWLQEVVHVYAWHVCLPHAWTHNNKNNNNSLKENPIAGTYSSVDMSREHTE